MKNIKRETLNIILVVASILIVAGLGSLFVNLGMNWFSQLQTPSQWIPNIVIPIVWTIIYVLFAIILSILYKDNLITKKTTILALINGVLNVLWCLTFFTLEKLLLGNVVILINAFFATALLLNLVKIQKWYVNLLWIYTIWIYIATTLNLALWILN